MANARSLYLNSGVQKQLQYNDVLVANGLDFLNDGVNPFPATVNLFTTANSATTTVNFFTNLTNAGAKTLNIGTNLTTGDTITIGAGGAGGCKVDIGGDLEVSGDEVVIGDTTFETDVTFGNGGGTDITFAADAQVVSNLIFDTTGASRSITGDGGNALVLTNAAAGVTVSTTGASGNVSINASSTTGTATVTSAAGTTVNATAGGVTVNPTAGGVSLTPTAGAITITAPATSIWSTSTGNLSVTSASALTLTGAATSTWSLSSGNLTIDSASGTAKLDSATGTTIAADLNGVSITPVAGGVTINPTAGDVTITAPSTADLLLNSSGAGGTIALSSGAGGITATAGSTSVLLATNALSTVSEVVSFRQDADGTPYTAGIFVGTGSPDTVVTGSTGDMYLEVGSGTPYFCTGTTNWTAVGSAAGNNLQQTYDASGTPATILLTSGKNLRFETRDTATIAEFVVAHAGGADNFLTTTTTSSTAGTLDLGSTNVTIKPMNNIAFDTTGNPARSIGLGGSGTLTISQTGTGSMTVATTATGALNLTGAVNVNVTATTGELDLTSTAGAVDINANGGAVTIDSSAGNAVTITGHGSSAFTTDTGNLTLETTSAAGATTLQATGASGTVVISANGATAGKVTLNSTDGTVGEIELNSRLVDINGGTAGVTIDGSLITTGGAGATPHTFGATTFDVNASGAVTVDGSAITTGGAGATPHTFGATTFDVNASGDLTLDTSAAAANLTSSNAAGVVTVEASGAGGQVVLNADGLTGNVNIVGGGSHVSVSTTNNGNISFTPNGSGQIQLVAASGSVSLRSGSAEVMTLHTYTATPEGAVTSTPGSLTLVETGGNVGQLWLKASGTGNAGWVQVATGDVSETLQDAYEAGNTITTSDAEGDLNFVLVAGAGAANSTAFKVYDASHNYVVCDGDTTTAKLVTLGDTTNVLLNVSGRVASNVTFDGTDGRTITNAGDMSVTATGAGNALTLTSAAAATWSTGAGVLTLQGAGGMNIGNGVAQAIAINSSTAATTIASGGTSSWNNAAGNLTLKTSGASGNIVVDADGTGGTALFDSTAGTTISADAGGVLIDPTAGGVSLTPVAGGVTVNPTAGNVAITAPAGDDVVILATNNAASDITFQAHGSNVIPINSATAGQTNLATAAQNVVGAINELLGMASDVKITVTSGEAYSVGDALYIKASDGRAYKTDSDASVEAARFIGFAVDAAIGAAETHTVYVAGEVTVSTDLAAMDNGAYVYISAATAGAVTTTAPGTGTVLRVGFISDKGNDKVVIQVGEPVQL